MLALNCPIFKKKFKYSRFLKHAFYKKKIKCCFSSMLRIIWSQNTCKYTHNLSLFRSFSLSFSLLHKHKHRHSHTLTHTYYFLFHLTFFFYFIWHFFSLFIFVSLFHLFHFSLSQINDRCRMCWVLPSNWVHQSVLL